MSNFSMFYLLISYNYAFHCLTTEEEHGRIKKQF